MTEVAPKTPPEAAPLRVSDDPNFRPYDKRNLTYAHSFDSRPKQLFIRSLEALTGKLALLRRIRRFEQGPKVEGQPFWARALEVMDIPLLTPPEEVAQIPAKGPLVVVANHPHGLVDGMILAELIGRVRTDYKVLTRSIISNIQEVAQFMIPVPFPDEEDSLRKGLQMRQEAMEVLAGGGVIALFPAGAVANTDGFWAARAVEKEWNPFTAKMLLKSGASVLPIYFPGQNSRLYQWACQISPTLRQGLLVHEIAHALGRPQRPVIGAPIGPEAIARWANDPRGLMTHLRAETLALAARLPGHRAGRAKFLK